MLSIKQFNYLSPLARKVYAEMYRCGGITGHSAFRSLGILGNSLSKRICDIEQVGVKVIRDKKTDPVTGVRYTKYRLVNGKQNPVAA